MRLRFKRIASTIIVLGGGAYMGSLLTKKILNRNDKKTHIPHKGKPNIPSRNELLLSLQNEKFDILVIGGGATGTGCALDAASRGLKTALVEANDFASGTSSRSGKIINGGLIYFKKFLLSFNIDEYKIVKEILNERLHFFKVAPHLAKVQPIMIPIYHWWEAPYYWAGIKIYDVFSGSRKLKSSCYLTKKETLEIYPILKDKGLFGSMVYFDGQIDDARLCISLALSAIRHGATVLNHVRCLSLIKDTQGNLCGARLRDEVSGKEWDVLAKCIINATGPFTDSIRKMDDVDVEDICQPSSGIHIVLPGYYSPEKSGILVTKTRNDQDLSSYWFLMPWKNKTLVGNTDISAKPIINPQPTEEEIMYLLQNISDFVNPDVKVKREDVLSAWCGIRPLVGDTNSNTKRLSRHHLTQVSQSRLVTISGGKWTTYRAMAQEAVDSAVRACDLKPARDKCISQNILLEGAYDWSISFYFKLIQDFGLESSVAQHLAETYGGKAVEVAKLATSTGRNWPIVGKKLHYQFPYIEAEIRYGVKEYAVTAVDMIARRLRFAFLNAQVALEVLPRVIDIMAEELQWSQEEKKLQHTKALEFLQTEMGLMLNKKSRNKMTILLSKEDIKLHIKRFRSLDKDNKGVISLKELCKGIKDINVYLSEEDLKGFVEEVAMIYDTPIRLEDFIQIMSTIRTGHVQKISPTDKELLRKQLYDELSELSLQIN
uniref:Glycerol-3-phosphate dehydrogenase n=1 Tax=Clastoptera arizonana TaxID=38151 RepID=A0A1B6D6V9_9HEMI